MNDKHAGSQNSPQMGLAALGIGTSAVVCGAGLPLIAGVLGGVALGSVLGVGAGALAVIVAVVLVVARARRQRACAAARGATRRSGPAIDWPQVAAYRDDMIRGLDDAAQVKAYRDDGVDVFKGDARIDGPGPVAVDGQVLGTNRIIVATGSDAQIPPIDGLQEAGYWTNREDPVVGELIATALRDEGIELRLGCKAVSVQRKDGARVVALDDGEQVSGRELLVATGRAPRVHDIGLESIGITPDPAGLQVDERCRAVEGVWAMPVSRASGSRPRVSRWPT